MTDMNQKIEAQLALIEDSYHVTILFACESGSRAWGFASPDSDYDVRFIYVHQPDWYLRVCPQRDVIELPISDALDINGWELRKALALLKKGNATLLEWLSSPIVYQKRTYFERRMRLEAITLCYQPERAFYHYLHMAKRNFQEYLQGEQVKYKKYLYVLRPIFAAQWIEQHRRFPPIGFESLFQQMVHDDTPIKEVVTLLSRQKIAALETETTPKIVSLNDYIRAELTRLATCEIIHETPDFTILDHILNDMVTRFYDMSRKDHSVIPNGYDCCDHKVVCPYWQISEMISFAVTT
jgi:predicted nucleotidyltransferase